MTDIQLKLPMGATGTIEVFDLLGRRVFDKHFVRTEAGEVEVTFNATSFTMMPYVCIAKVHFADGSYQERKLSLIGTR